ncbi:MAG TPA: endonuclease III [Terriglobales bacterium]|nr:endonuclease III [Terriglobales bacterium]
MDAARLRIKPIIRLLRRHYPQARTALAYVNPLQVLVATILAAQSTDKLVNTVTPALFKKYPSAEAFAKADRAELETMIHSTGFFRNKAKSLIGAAQCIVGVYGGRVPDSMDALLTLPGVARKTANIVLSAGFGKAEGIAVDTHARRVSQRLGLTKCEDPVKIERDLLALVPQSDWIDFNFLLVDHGRSLCQARKPQCPACFLKTLCPSATKLHPELRKA